MKEISGGVCAPRGFLAGGVALGIKKGSVKKDLALIYSPKTCVAAAMFTKNKVKAACVEVTRENIADGKLRAIIANSGNANACAGEEGMAAARKMARLASSALAIDPGEVAVASTGVIGVPLPIGKIESGMDALKASLSAGGNADALTAIMTTDTRMKEIAFEIEIEGVPVRVGAMAKGSGMIHPNMATMLAFITTDAAIEKGALDLSLRLAIKKSFNRVTVDGDTSTNDMVVIMANGEAGNKRITENDKSFAVFASALKEACVFLARMMARDGEGATKLVTVKVSGAENEESAETLAKSVASSSLVKAACFGADANWGRVLCAMGYAGVDFTPEETDISFSSAAGTVKVCENGMTIPFSEEKAKAVLSEEEIEILINARDGNAEAEVWGCDLTYDYVKINGDYRT